MSDPTEITQGQEAGVIATVIGALTLFAGAFAKLWRVIFGSPKDRADAKAQEADAQATLVEAALDVAEARGEDSRRFQVERDDCQTQLDQMRQDIRIRDKETAEALRALRVEITGLRTENASLRREVRLQRKALDGLLSNTPNGMYTGDDVRAAMDSQQEE